MRPLSPSADAQQSTYRSLQWAAVSSSAGVVLLLAAMLWPRPLVIVFAMSGGAALMLCSLGLFALAVLKDLRGHQVL